MRPPIGIDTGHPQVDWKEINRYLTRVADDAILWMVLERFDVTV
jgi:hypothetical protein